MLTNQERLERIYNFLEVNEKHFNKENNVIGVVLAAEDNLDRIYIVVGVTTAENDNKLHNKYYQNYIDFDSNGNIKYISISNDSCDHDHNFPKELKERKLGYGVKFLKQYVEDKVNNKDKRKLKELEDQLATIQNEIAKVRSNM